MRCIIRLVTITWLIVKLAYGVNNQQRIVMEMTALEKPRKRLNQVSPDWHFDGCEWYDLTVSDDDAAGLNATAGSSVTSVESAEAGSISLESAR